MALCSAELFEHVLVKAFGSSFCRNILQYSSDTDTDVRNDCAAPSEKTNAASAERNKASLMP